MNINDFMDDFVFGPMNWIAYVGSWIMALVKRRPIVRKAVRRFDKGGNYPVLDLMQVMSRNGIRFLGSQRLVTHNSKNFYVVISLRQARMFDYLYNFESDTLRQFVRRWQG